jgi:hypothetical protein
VITFRRRTFIAALARTAAFGAPIVAVACGDDGAAPAAVPAAIRYVTQPAGVVAGVPFTAVVELLKGNGDRAVDAAAIVRLDVVGTAALSGATAVAAARGVATFDDLVITQVAASLRLDATAAGRAATGQQFSVAPGPPSPVRSAFTPTELVWVSGTPVPMSFTFADAFGNALAGLPVTLSSGLAGALFVPASGTTSPEGTFESVFHPTAGGSATITATIGGSAFAFDTPFLIREFCRAAPLAIPGTATGTLPAEFCDASGRPAAVHAFSLAAAGAVAFTTTATFAPRVEVKTSVAEGNPEFLPTTQFPRVEWLLPAGSYLFRISAQSGTGTYTARADPVAGTSAATSRAIITSGTYTGQSLQLNDFDFGDGTVFDYYLMFSQRPCTITLRSTDFDAFLWVEDAIELQFTDDDDNSGGGTDARIHFEQCNNQGRPLGVYANSNPTPQLGPGLGSYTLIVEFDGLPAGVPPDRRERVGIETGIALRAALAAPALRAGARHR